MEAYSRGALRGAKRWLKTTGKALKKSAARQGRPLSSLRVPLNSFQQEGFVAAAEGALPG